MTHAITSTTQVRIAVPRFDSTPLMPTLPRIACRHGVKEPALFFVVVSIDLFLDHQKCTDGDQHNADALCNADGLAEKDEREKHGQNRTRLIDRHDLVDVSDLQGMKIAEPGRTGREARQNQEKKCPSTDRADR